jgi:multidrug efflux pump subunit AcrA (membrane-fusion protein)
VSGDVATLQTPRQGAFGEAQVWRDLLGSDDPGVFSQAWLRLLASSIDQCLTPLSVGDSAVLGGFVAMRLGTEQRFSRTATIGGGEVSFMLAKAAERCLQVRRPVGQTGGGAGAAGSVTDLPTDAPIQIAVPVMVGDVMEAVVALELRPSAEPHLDLVTRLAQWGTAWFRRILAPRDELVDLRQRDMIVRALAVAAVAGSLPSVGQSMCTFLADRLDLMRVSLGMAERGPQKVIATSRGGLTKNKTDFLVALGAALDEAVSAGETVMWPVPETQIAAIGAHDRLCRSHDADWAVSVPVTIDRLTQVICFEGKGPIPEPATVQTWQEMVRLVTPLLALRHDAQQSLPQHTLTAVRHVASDWTIGGNAWRWAGLATTVGIVLFALFVRGDARVASKATLEGAILRAITVPFDGYLADATAKPGDRVLAGQVLARLDDRDLRLQQLVDKAKIAESQREVIDGVGRHDTTQASVATARRQQGEAELKLVEDNLSRASLTAPFDAVVISGDPTQQIGAPVRHGETLYELSPLDRYRVAIDVDEADFAEVLPGQTGGLLLSSLPYEIWPVEVQRVTPIASAKDGHTVFRVDARLVPNSADQEIAMRRLLRPGMAGVAKIDIGPRRYAWMWTHTMLSWARLKVWEWLP